MVTNDEAIRTWGATPADFLASLDPDGGFAKRHLVNPHLLRLVGEVAGKRVLDAGCGQGYLSRMLAERGASVVGLEPGESLIAYCRAREAELGQGITYVQADLSRPPPDLGAFDVVVCSMVLCAIPDWRPAMRACVDSLRPGGDGRFVLTLNHPCFELLAESWREHGDYRTTGYVTEYELAGPHGTDFHRTLSTYLNELVRLGGRLVELVEPVLPPAALEDPDAGPGAEAYLDLPNFVLVAASKG